MREPEIWIDCDRESDSGYYFCVAVRAVGMFVAVVPDISDIDVFESDFFAYIIRFL